MKKILRKHWLLFFGLLLIVNFILPSTCRAMVPGALVYRTSSDGKMYGYSGDPLISSKNGVMTNIFPGHVGIYIGKENGVDYIVEAISGGVVMTPADKFVNTAEGEKYLGAKIPKDLTAAEQAKVVKIARSLAGKNLAYDFDYKTQKGPNSGQWTCVGLAEKIYESADISNPNNLDSLEYDYNYYAIDITSDGFDNYSVVNSNGDCFSKDYEFSKIARQKNLLLPAPELIGYDVGLEIEGERFIFLPYTQFLQPTLSDTPTDIKISSSFSGSEVRGSYSALGLVTRWSLINNPISSVKIIAQKTGKLLANLKDKIFGTNSGDLADNLVFNDVVKAASPELAAAVQARAIINKATKSDTDTKAKESAKEKTSTMEKLTAQASGDKSKKLTAKVVKNSELIAKSAAKTAEKTATKTETKAATKADTKTSVKADTKTNTKTATKNKETAKTTTKATTYYTPVSTPVSNVSSGSGKSSSGSGGGSSSGSQAADNYPKIATIDKIYSTGDDDWIELYNSTDHDFDLAAAGYRIERAKTGDDPVLVMRIGEAKDGSYPGGTVIKAHKYYLIVKNTASSYYLKKANAIATRDEFSWPGSGYTLYLGKDAISASNDPDIVEAVGFGSDATYFQGKGPAQEIKDYYVLDRVKSTSDNSVDFTLIKSDNPAIDWTAAENKNNGGSNSTSGALAGNTTSDPLILINKIYATEKDDWIELYNPSDNDFDLAANNYRLERSKTSENPSLLMRIGDSADGLYPKGTVIKAKSNYLIVRNDVSDFYKSKANAIATKTDFAWDGSGYTFYLGKDAISSSTDSDIIGAVGFGPDAGYFQGDGPAPAIDDNYILNRVANSGNNKTDFNLIKSDNPNIDWYNLASSTNSANGVYKFSASAYNLFPEPIPISSEGLKYLWHFDKCSGSEIDSTIGSSSLISSGVWLAGKFDCAQEQGGGEKKAQTSFPEAIDINNFSLSFWFKSTQDSPRLSLTLSNKDEDSINITLENGLMQFSGLPNPDWRYNQEFPFDNTWRQATLVVNRSKGYWALYVDGVEKFHINSYEPLAPMDKLVIGGDNGSYAIDELALWDRALTPEEVSALRNSEQPFSPIIYRESQKIPVLKHFWNFNEGIGTTTKDLIGETDLVINKEAWKSLSLTNSIFVSSWDKNINIDFPALESSDLSLTFWWRSVDTNGNRTRIALLDSSKNNVLSLNPSHFSSGFKISDREDYFSYGQDLAIPFNTNWHQLALVYDSYRHLIYFYVDGEEKGEKSFLWPANRPLASALEVVSENGVIELDDLGVWEGALSSGQIKEIFANN